MTRAAIYARVSSAAQRETHTIESQLHVLRPYVAQQGWTLVGEYLDDGRSAKTGKLEARDGFARLVADAARGAFDVLAVADIDRLTRTDSIEERAAILGPFQRANVRIVSPSGGEIDLRTMFGQIDATLRALYAAEENRKRAERIKAGKLRAIAEGRKPAGPTPYGLRYDRATATWSIDAERAAVLREIFDRVVRGESCMAIAEDLYSRNAPSPRGPWSRHKVWHLVRSRHAMGQWTADKRKRAVISVPGIVEESTWAAAQERLIEHGKRGLIKTKHVYLLEGIARCGACGSPISIRSATGYVVRGEKRRNPAAYVCRSRKLARIGETRCDEPIVRTAELDAAVWEELRRELESPGLAKDIERYVASRSANRRAWADDVKTYRRKLEKLDAHEAALLARFRREQISEAALDKELAAVARERTALRQQLDAAERAASTRADHSHEALSSFVARLRDLAKTASPTERQRIVRALVAKGGAVMRDGAVELTLRVAATSRDASGAEAAPSLAVASF
ncbi:MAG: recombinase family protein [Deltaproteobacteria bacterium]|nr:recombinase family protein [Deltaproteobacteria bacterium]